MSTRPTTDDVRAIITTLRTDTQVEVFIDTAILIAEDVLGSSGYSDGRIKAIHTWLAAHLLASTKEEGVLSSESVGDASFSYHRANLGMALRGTTYGQQALMLDVDDLLDDVGVPTATIEAM